MGQGVTKDYAEAMKWYLKSAEHGDMLAQFCLGAMYYLGQGVTQDFAEAFKWYHKAAEQGCDSAMWSVAQCYDDGTTTTRGGKISLISTGTEGVITLGDGVDYNGKNHSFK